MQSEDPSRPDRLVICPNCKGESLYAPSNPFRPFCGERCKNIDFGAWASEGFRLPTDVEPEEPFSAEPRLQ